MNRLKKGCNPRKDRLQPFMPFYIYIPSVKNLRRCRCVMPSDVGSLHIDAPFLGIG